MCRIWTACLLLFSPKSSGAQKWEKGFHLCFLLQQEKKGEFACQTQKNTLSVSNIATKHHRLIIQKDFTVLINYRENWHYLNTHTHTHPFVLAPSRSTGPSYSIVTDLFTDDEQDGRCDTDKFNSSNLNQRERKSVSMESRFFFFTVKYFLKRRFLFKWLNKSTSSHTILLLCSSDVWAGFAYCTFSQHLIWIFSLPRFQTCEALQLRDFIWRRFVVL